MKTLLLSLALASLVVGGCGRHQTQEPTVDLLESDEVYEFRATQKAKSGYTLATGDLIDTSFLFEPQLSTKVRVRPDGAVSLPILGDVAVAGQTPMEVDSLLTAAYGTYFQDPEVTINVLEFAPARVFVMGEVRAPREIELRPGMTAVQALALAGGPLPQANLGSVVLLRRLGDDKAMAQRMDLGDFLKGKGRSWDMLLAPSDIIYVPTSFVAKMDRFINQFFGGLTPIPVLYLRGWEAFNTGDVYDTFLRPPGN